MSRPILSIDFDGVIHSYTTKWQGADVIPDPPVEGAMRFLWDATEHFRVCIFSTRSHQPGGIAAMKAWLRKHFLDHWAADMTQALDKFEDDIEWPTTKPPALVMIDDRAVCFEGQWPDIEKLRAFKPWNKRPLPDPPATEEGAGG
jgi:hypothetical protein